MQVNVKELSLVVAEANALSNKATLTQHEQRRYNFLLSAAAVIRSGASLLELEQDSFNEHARASGLPVETFKRETLTREQRDTATMFQHFAKTPKEQRDVEGAIIPRLGSYSSLGSFVPTEFFGDVFAQLKAHDPLFDEDFCTVINATNGRVETIPTMSDIHNVASIVGEAGSQTETDIYFPGQVELGTYAYKTPRWSCSLEAFQDLQGSLSAYNLFTRFASDRIRRGVGADLINGNGETGPLGLMASLEALSGVTTAFITAAGSSANDGSANTGANSIGSTDLSNLYYSVDSAYRASDKCAWIMSDSTLNSIDALLDKYGSRLGIVKWDSGVPTILGKPVRVSPSMQPIGASNTSVVFGDFSYWVTKLVTGQSENGTPIGYVQSYTEAPGLIEAGLVGFRAFFRAGGVLAVQDRNAPLPLNYLMQHS